MYIHLKIEASVVWWVVPSIIHQWNKGGCVTEGGNVESRGDCEKKKNREGRSVSKRKERKKGAWGE